MPDKNAVKTKMSHHACDILANRSLKMRIVRAFWQPAFPVYWFSQGKAKELLKVFENLQVKELLIAVAAELPDCREQAWKAEQVLPYSQSVL